VWRDNTGTNNMLPNDDIGGTIGDGQYDQWRANFGATAPEGAGAGLGTGAVPEPTSLLLIAAGLLPMGARFKRGSGPDAAEPWRQRK
jgi:hypothetical protein